MNLLPKVYSYIHEDKFLRRVAIVMTTLVKITHDPEISNSSIILTLVNCIHRK